MYPISEAFKRVLGSRTGRNRSIVWRGTITLTDGTTHDFTTDNIAQGTGTLTCSCELPGVGGAYSTEFLAQMFIAIDPRKLEGADIALFVRLIYFSDVATWGDAAMFFWPDLKPTTWSQSPRLVYTDVPMGHYLVAEAKRAINSIKITAYDNMQKFNRALPRMDTTARTPFEWLRWMCNTCGVELGMTNAQLRKLTNGARNFTYADIDSNVKTCRDLLSHLAAVMGAIAIIDRSGKLVFLQHGIDPVAEVTPDDRFTSDFADYQSYYTGIYAQYKAKATQEYYHNVGTLNDNGLIIDLGTNIFLQISNDSNRATAVQAVIDAFKNKQFTPFDVTMPFNPTFDLLDALAFSGGHTPQNSVAPITYLSRKIGGTMTVRCDTPEAQADPVRETTQVDGLSGGGGMGTGAVYASSGFWILAASFPDTATIIGDDTLTTELTVNCTVDNTCTQIAWTGTYTLDENALVTVKILVDEEEIYRVSDKQTAGPHTLNVTTGHNITTQGNHYVKVIIREDVL